MAADYKQKYFNLRTKMLESSDVAFRLGYEQGMQDAMMQQMQQQMQMMQQQQMAAEQSAAQGGAVDENGNPIEGAEQGTPITEGSPDQQLEAAAGGSPIEESVDSGESNEMDSGVGSELDDHISELEGLVAKGEKPSVLEMRKAVEKIANLRKSQKQKLNSKMKAVESSQKKLVDNILKKWEDEAKGASSEIEDIIRQHEMKKED